jgi:hypothetical protein
MVAAAAACAMLLGGCGRPRYAVRGRVEREGGEIYREQGFVIAETAIDGKLVSARAVIGVDGGFILAGRFENDGVMAGTYRVRLVPPRGAGDIDAGGSAPLPYDKKFTSFETSGLTLEVGPGQPDFTIKVGPKPAR